MGLDFLRRCAPAFHKALDRRAIELRTPTLFSSDLSSVARTAQADICENSHLTAGERLLVRLHGESLVVQRANVVVARFSNPPGEYLNVVRLGCGIAGAEVKVVHPMSGIAEVFLCE